jgi:hypothetical protein
MIGEKFIFTIAIDKHNGKDYSQLNNAKRDARIITQIM